MLCMSSSRCCKECLVCKHVNSCMLLKLKAYFHSQGDILWHKDMPDVGDVIFIDPSRVSKVS